VSDGYLGQGVAEVGFRQEAGRIGRRRAPERITQEGPAHVHADVGSAGMLELVDRHAAGTLAGDGLVVAGNPLLLVVGAVTGLTDEEVDLVDAAVRNAADVIGIDLVVEVPPPEGDRVGVVHRYLPPGHGDPGVPLARRRGGQRRVLRPVRETELRDPDPDPVVRDTPAGREDDAVATVGRFPMDDGQLRPATAEAGAGGEGGVHPSTVMLLCNMAVW